MLQVPRRGRQRRVPPPTPWRSAPWRAGGSGRRARRDPAQPAPLSWTPLQGAGKIRPDSGGRARRCLSQRRAGLVEGEARGHRASQRKSGVAVGLGPRLRCPGRRVRSLGESGWTRSALSSVRAQSPPPTPECRAPGGGGGPHCGGEVAARRDGDWSLDALPSPRIQPIYFWFSGAGYTLGARRRTKGLGAGWVGGGGPEPRWDPWPRTRHVWSERLGVRRPKCGWVGGRRTVVQGFLPASLAWAARLQKTVRARICVRALNAARVFAALQPRARGAQTREAPGRLRRLRPGPCSAEGDTEPGGGGGLAEHTAGGERPLPAPAPPGRRAPPFPTPRAL